MSAPTPLPLPTDADAIDWLYRRCIGVERKPQLEVESPVAATPGRGDGPMAEPESQLSTPHRPDTAPAHAKPWPGHIIRCPSCTYKRFDWMAWDYGACERRQCGYEWRPNA